MIGKKNTGKSHTAYVSTLALTSTQYFSSITRTYTQYTEEQKRMNNPKNNNKD